MKRISLILILVVSFICSFDNTFALDTATYTQSRESLKSLTPDMALTLLKEGNERFVSGKMKNRNFLAQAKITKKGQYPFAFILSCIDSRGSPELIFDQGIGDIFAGRVAGNIVDADQLGGMEFATKLMGAHIILVLGHTSCGAVRGACSDAKLGNLTQLLNKIKPAVNTIRHDHNNSVNCDDNQIVNAMTKQNVLNMIEEIKAKSPVIKKLIDEKTVIIVGGMHDLRTGRVTFF